MKDRIETVRCLASHDLQDRYIVGGTADEYILPDELIGDVLSLVELVESGVIGQSLTPPQRGLLRDLRVAAEAVEPVLISGITNAELIARNPEWLAAREAARRFIAAYDGGEGR